MSTTRSRLESSILAPIDIADQMAREYVFLTEGVTGTQAFAVDGVRVVDGIVQGVIYQTPRSALSPPGTIPVISVALTAAWACIARDVMVLRTLEASVRKQKADREAEAELLKTVFGVEEPAAPKVPRADLLDRSHLYK